MLTRHTPLPRPSHRIAPLGQRGRRRAAVQRKSRREVFAAAGGRCMARVSPHCTGRAEHAHHLKKRRSGDDSPANNLATCGFCNIWIEENPREARALGLTISVNQSPVMKGAM